MIRILIGTILLVAFAALTDSCSIQKRKHLPGWYINTSWSKSSKAIVTTAQNEKSAHIDSSKIDRQNKLAAKSETSTHGPLMDVQVLMDDEPVLFDEAPAKGRSIRVNKATEQFNLKRKVSLDAESFTSSRARFKKLKKISSDDEKTSRFWPTFIGGLLGVLLALIVLTPLFLLLLLFNDGELDDEIFSTSFDDSFFVTSFKNAFNAVMKFGIIVLWILLLLTLLVGLFYLGFIVAGVLGGIIAVLLFVGLIALLAFLLGNLVDFILPDY